MPFDREMIEARLALRLISADETPRIAWDALEAGLDGPAVRRLAALVLPTPLERDEVLPRAMKEMGLAQLTKGEAARRMAVRRAREILRSGEDPMRHLKWFEWLWVRSEHAPEVCEFGILKEDAKVAELCGVPQERIVGQIRGLLAELCRE